MAKAAEIPFSPMMGSVLAYLKDKARRRGDRCGMVYYDPKTLSYYYVTHRSGDWYQIVRQYNGASNEVADIVVTHCYSTRAKAQADLDTIAERWNMIRKPALTGHWR